MKIHLQPDVPNSEGTYCRYLRTVVISSMPLVHDRWEVTRYYFQCSMSYPACTKRSDDEEMGHVESGIMWWRIQPTNHPTTTTTLPTTNQPATSNNLTTTTSYSTVYIGEPLKHKHNNSIIANKKIITTNNHQNKSSKKLLYLLTPQHQSIRIVHFKL